MYQNAPSFLFLGYLADSYSLLFASKALFTASKRLRPSTAYEYLSVISEALLATAEAF